MGKTVLNKLRSGKGASITFALLAFLVCAVISAVLLASASAAAGRVSELAEMDQRNYAVTSAAQLFCDALDGQSITIEQIKSVTETNTTVYKYENGDFILDEETTVTVDNPNVEEGTSYALNVGSSEYTAVEVTSNTNFPKDRSLLTEAALYYLFGSRIDSTNSFTDILTYLVAPNFETSDTPAAFTPRVWDLVLEVGSKAYLKVDVHASMSANGNIELTFTNNTAGTDKFSVVVELGADINESESTGEAKFLGSGSYLSDDKQQLVTWRTTCVDTTKRTEIKWTVTKVKKGSA